MSGLGDVLSTRACRKNVQIIRVNSSGICKMCSYSEIEKYQAAKFGLRHRQYMTLFCESAEKLNGKLWRAPNFQPG